MTKISVPTAKGPEKMANHRLTVAAVVVGLLMLMAPAAADSGVDPETVPQALETGSMVTGSCERKKWEGRQAPFPIF